MNLLRINKSVFSMRKFTITPILNRKKRIPTKTASKSQVGSSAMTAFNNVHKDESKKMNWFKQNLDIFGLENAEKSAEQKSDTELQTLIEENSASVDHKYRIHLSKLFKSLSDEEKHVYRVVFLKCRFLGKIRSC